MDLSVGNHMLHVSSATLNRYGNACRLDFEMQSDTILSAHVYLKDHPWQVNGGGGGKGKFTTGISYSDLCPALGQQEIVVTNIIVLADSSLQIEWQP